MLANVLIQTMSIALTTIQTIYIIKICKNLENIQPAQGKKIIARIFVLEVIKIIIAVISYSLNIKIRMLRTTFPILVFSTAMYIKYNKTTDDR